MVKMALEVGPLVTKGHGLGWAVRSAVERFEGQLAGLVYAVGSIPIKSARQATAEEMLQAFRLNAVGATGVFCVLILCGILGVG